MVGARRSGERRSQCRSARWPADSWRRDRRPTQRRNNWPTQCGKRASSRPDLYQIRLVPRQLNCVFLARGQQVIRADTESFAPLPSTPAELLVSWAKRTVAEVDAVLLSDYGKGIFAEGLAGRIIEAARHAGRPVVVDPKGTDARQYRGATVVKPNLGELSDLTGRRIRSVDDLIEAGCRLADELLGSVVLVTRGPEGMALFRAGHLPLTLNAAPARRVFDVTGAGDTAAATLALALGAGFCVEVAARVANAAGGVAVSKVGTAVVTPRRTSRSDNRRGTRLSCPRVAP